MCNIANDERRSSVIVFLEFNQSGVFITKSWLRTRKMLKIETTAQNFKIFFSLQVRTCVYTYRTLRACQWPVTSDQWLVPSDQWPVTSDQWPVTSYQLFRPAGLETEVTKGFLVSLQLLCLRWIFKRGETVTLTRLWTRTARCRVQHVKYWATAPRDGYTNISYNSIGENNKSKWHTRTPTHGLASTLRMRITISPVQWQHGQLLRPS